MLPAIVAYTMAGLLLLWGIDRLWPIWLIHVLAIAGGIVVVALAVLAGVAARRRR